MEGLPAGELPPPILAIPAYCQGHEDRMGASNNEVRRPNHHPFPSDLHAALAACKSAFALAADFFLVPLAMPCETAFSTAPSVAPFFTAFRTAFSIFLTA